MIEANWSKIRDPEMTKALESLAKQRLPYPTTLKILTFSKALEMEQIKSDEMAMNLRDKYLKKTENGWEIKDESLASEFREAEKQFLETTFKLKGNKIKGEELKDSLLSAVELHKLDWLVEIGDEEA